MKKFIVSFVFFGFLLNVHAQSQMGFRVSYLIPNYRITSTPPGSSETMSEDNGLAYTLNYKRRWPGVFNFGVEMEYNQTKSNFESEYQDLDIKVHRTTDFITNYIDFRLLPEFVYGKKLKAYFQVGPFLGVLVKSSATGSYCFSDDNGNVSCSLQDGTATDDFPIIDWGIFFGGGIEYPLFERLKLALELQYSRGFARFTQKDNYVFATRNFTTGLSLIYVFKGYSERK